MYLLFAIMGILLWSSITKIANIPSLWTLELAQFTLVAGQPLDEDIRAELSLLRAELDLLKRAFQRHVRES